MSITPAVLPPAHYLQLPAPASSSGSQQLRLCGQSVCKPDIAVKEVGLLVDVGHWIKESTCAMVPSSEQVCAAPSCALHTPMCISICHLARLHATLFALEICT